MYRLSRIFLYLSLVAAVAGANVEYSVASFNVQVFGQTKMDNPFVVQALVDMFRMYDIICMQEIRDTMDSAFLELLREINKVGLPHYDAHVTQPRGRSASKEQEAYLWRSDAFHFIHAHPYKETNDEFEREPDIVLIEHLASGTQFGLLGIHITPSDVAAEMDALIDVYDQGTASLATTSVLILGDLNAGCSYLSNSAREALLLWTDTNWAWLLPEGTDTTVATSSCPYDRMIATKDFETLVVPGSAGVYRFDEEMAGLSTLCSKHVSDHYPIEMGIKFGAREYLIASFNVQVFGTTKWGKADVAEILVEIFRRYDIVVMQEVRDSSDTAFNDLVAAINAKGGDQYDSFLTQKHGRSTSVEQEGYVWKRDLFTMRDSFEYVDTNDDFEREPTPVLLRETVGSSEFFLIGTHISPQSVATEMEAMVAVWDEAVATFGTDYGLILGDLNAGCSYLSASARDALTLKTDPRFVWLLPEDTDTTVAKSSCPYDRFISSTKFETYRFVPGTAKAFRFDDPGSVPTVPADCAEDISDHYPVYASLNFPMPPTVSPSLTPTTTPSAHPSVSPSTSPPSKAPLVPGSPTESPVVPPTKSPSMSPSASPSSSPRQPSAAPTKAPLPPGSPTESPRRPPTVPPTSPSVSPTKSPLPQGSPTQSPASSPTDPPSLSPTKPSVPAPMPP
eukprot:Hpha_TRINITY_DN14700_c0_g1::TRINITY_DN14700_c0_g1_i2::g.102773::m.102773